MRIYSFLPSATEILYSLGLGADLCGVTSECDYPPRARTKPIVVESAFDPARLEQGEIDNRVVESMAHGHGLYRINKERLARDKPDLVITQELCDVCSVSLRDVLQTVSDLKSECRVLSLKPKGLQGVFDDITTIGEACGVGERARELVRALDLRVKQVREVSRRLEKRRVFFVEWYDPIFASGHWVPEMILMAGGIDALASVGGASKKIDWERVVEYDPEVLVLAPCGFGLDRTLADLALLTRRVGWDELSAVRAGRVYAADGSSYFSRPGPRLVDGLEILAKMIHPEFFGRSFPKGAATIVEPPRLSARN